MSLPFDRVYFNTATTGTGTITAGAAVADWFLTPAEAGVANTDAVTLLLREGSDFELSTGSYTTTGTTISRDTVLVSKIAGTQGTTKMSLGGNATGRLVWSAADIATLLADLIDDTSPQLGGNLDGNDQQIDNYQTTIAVHTGTTYTFVAADTGKTHLFTNAAAITVTCPNSLAEGWHATVIQGGAGQVTFAAGASATLRNVDSEFKLSGQWAMGTLVVDANAGSAANFIFGGNTA